MVIGKIMTLLLFDTLNFQTLCIVTYCTLASHFIYLFIIFLPSSSFIRQPNEDMPFSPRRCTNIDRTLPRCYVTAKVYDLGHFFSKVEKINSVSSKKGLYIPVMYAQFLYSRHMPLKVNIMSINSSAVSVCPCDR